MIQLIGLAGRAGCGKTFAAQHLVRYGGYVRTRFADPMKDMLRVIGLSDDEIEGPLKEAPTLLLCGKTPRFALQRLGTEWGRHLIGQSFWVDAWSRRADAILTEGRAVVVDDVRFPNEIEAIRKRGGNVIWIERGTVDTSGHVSEALSPDACDVTVVNTGDEGFIQSLAGAILEEVLA